MRKRKKPDLLERLTEFDAIPDAERIEVRIACAISDAEKIEVRIAWLEKKLLGVLYLLINATAVLMACIAGWFVRDTVGITTYCLLGPLFLVTWVGVAAWAHHRTFRDMPPHLDFVDPDL
jgi:hypothetical protein